jgi:hypothetical protein
VKYCNSPRPASSAKLAGDDGQQSRLRSASEGIDAANAVNPIRRFKANEYVRIPDILRWATVLPIAFISGPGTPKKTPH